MTTTAGPPAASAAKRGQGSWLNAVSGGFLALVLIGGLGVVLWPDGNQPPSPAADPAVAGAAAVPDKDAIPSTAPTDVTWELVSGRAVPRSATAGPTKITGPVHAGYAHTPTGAVLAALNIDIRATLTPGSGWRSVITQQVEPGPGRDVLEKARQALTDLTPPAGGYGQTAGFRIASYSPTQAVIEQAIRFPSGLLNVAALTVTWRSGDWRLVLQKDGSSSPYVAALQSLEGFTPFSGGL